MEENCLLWSEPQLQKKILESRVNSYVCVEGGITWSRGLQRLIPKQLLFHCVRNNKQVKKRNNKQ